MRKSTYERNKTEMDAAAFERIGINQRLALIRAALHAWDGVRHELRVTSTIWGQTVDGDEPHARYTRAWAMHLLSLLRVVIWDDNPRSTNYTRKYPVEYNYTRKYPVEYNYWLEECSHLELDPGTLDKAKPPEEDKAPSTRRSTEQRSSASTPWLSSPAPEVLMRALSKEPRVELAPGGLTVVNEFGNPSHPRARWHTQHWRNARIEWEQQLNGHFALEWPQSGRFPRARPIDTRVARNYTARRSPPDEE